MAVAGTGHNRRVRDRMYVIVSDLDSEILKEVYLGASWKTPIPKSARF